MESLGLFARVVVRLLARTPLLNAFWDKDLKANGAYEKRFDRPYAAK
jgi:hypothetical protein